MGTMDLSQTAQPTQQGSRHTGMHERRPHCFEGLFNESFKNTLVVQIHKDSMNSMMATLQLDRMEQDVLFESHQGFF